MTVKEKILQVLNEVTDLGSALDVGLEDKLQNLNIEAGGWISVILDIEEAFNIVVEDETMDDLIDNGKTVKNLIEVIQKLTDEKDVKDKEEEEK